MNSEPSQTWHVFNVGKGGGSWVNKLSV